MKIRFLAVLVGFLTIPLFAQTNNVSTNTPQSVKQVTQATLNQVLIEMLSGVKTAGAEIYAVSKEMLHKGVDFVQEQAPDVVRQFLTWKFFQAVTWAGIWFFIFLLFMYFANKCRLMQKNGSKDDGSNKEWSTSFTGAFWKWSFTVVAMAFLVFGVSPNIFEMVKIKVAPKVYIIEYVVDLAKDSAANQGCHR